MTHENPTDPPASGVSMSFLEDNAHRIQSTADGCLLWTGSLTATGYGEVNLKINGIWRRRVVHKVVWQEEHGPVPEGLELLHQCDTKRCCNTKHLKVGTHAQNMAEWKQRQVANKGSANGMSCLDETTVREIRKLCAFGVPQKVVAAKFSISVALVSRIFNYERWKHI